MYGSNSADPFCAVPPARLNSNYSSSPWSLPTLEVLINSSFAMAEFSKPYKCICVDPYEAHPPIIVFLIMLRLSIHLRQTPVLLSSSCANISECQMVPLVGHVSVRNGHSREVGGIRIVWEAQVQRRCRKRNGKYYWTDGDIIDRFEVDVLRGPIYLPAGASA